MPATREAFDNDGGRFPLPHYVSGNLVEDPDGVLRPLLPEDREVFMGFPVGYTSQPCSFSQVCLAEVRQLLLHDTVEGMDSAERKGLPF